MRPLTLGDWLSYLEELHPKTIELGLTRVNHVKRRLGLDPACAIVTVGGTNGKGSVCALLDAILSSAGYDVGCYTSPHLLRYNERIRIRQKEAPDGAICAALARVEDARGETPLTYFEFGTLAAMLLFQDARVDAAVLEVGLGGRLDAVNIFDGECAILTSVGLDHTDYLGNTRDAIGLEKAGIFRKDRPAICAEPECPPTVAAHAAAIGAQFLQIGEHFGFVQHLSQWDFWGPQSKRHGLPHPALRGPRQLRNAAACISALDEMRARLPVSAGDIRNGLIQVSLTGRFQVLPGRPAVVLDVAHNPQAVEVMAENLRNMGYYHNTYAVFGILRDKDAGAVVQAAAGAVDHWLVADLNLPRGASASALSRLLAKQGAASVETFESPASAYASACKKAGENDRIIVFGSFYTVADVLRSRNLIPAQA